MSALRVLLIEDSPTDTMIIRRLLEREAREFIVETATTGSQAQEILGKSRFDCLILDHMLPDTNSLEFLRHLRADHDDIPVVVITGQQHDWISHGSMEMGASQCLSKEEVLDGALPAALERAVAETVGPEDEAAPEKRKPADLSSLAARYRTLLDTMGGGVLTFDGRGNITFCNPQASKLLGLPPDKLLGKTFSVFLAEGDEHTQAVSQRAAEGGETRRCELELKLPRGKTLPVHISHAPLRNEEGAISGSIMVITDIQELRQAQTALAKTQAHYQTLIEIAPDAIVHIDLNGRVRYHNQQLCTLSGYDSSELENMRLADLLALEDQSSLEGLIRRTSREGQGSVIYRTRLRAKSGAIHHIEATTAPMEEQGRLTGIIAYMRDDTRRYRAEQLVEQAKAMAEFASDLMSHDINNLNQGVKGYLELLLETLEEGDKAAGFARAALDQVEATSQLITNVRHLLTIKGETPQLTPVNLAGVVAGALELAQSRHSQREVAVHGRIPGQAKVLADELLRDLFLNLADNGIKYNPAEKPCLTLTAQEDTLPQGPAWRVSVCDNGPGIPDGQKQALFDPSKRREVSAKGWGLGLSLVKALIDRYQGRIEVSDNPEGRGTCFQVILPMAEVEPKVMD